LISEHFFYQCRGKTIAIILHLEVPVMARTFMN